MGDLWVNTWADQDRLFLAWGDGTGLPGCVPSTNGLTPGGWCPWEPPDEVEPGCFDVSASEGCGVEVEFCRAFDCTACFPLCLFTDAGLLALEGTIPNFSECTGPEACVITRNLPTPELPPITPEGVPTGKDDKPSSLLYLDGRLYLAGHSPSGAPDYGYIAYSEDDGVSWTIVEGTPWTESSNFRVLSFVNMGESYSANSDGYVYAMGTSAELLIDRSMSVYLARVPRSAIDQYGQYEYWTGSSESVGAEWSGAESEATPMEGIQTYSQVSAMLHEGTGRYLLLSGVTSVTPGEGALFEAPQPWGPWTRVATLEGRHISSLISKDAGDRHVYLSRAGGSSTYNLHIGRIALEVDE